MNDKPSASECRHAWTQWEAIGPMFPQDPSDYNSPSVVRLQRRCLVCLEFDEAIGCHPDTNFDCYL